MRAHISQACNVRRDGVPRLALRLFLVRIVRREISGDGLLLCVLFTGTPDSDSSWKAVRPSRVLAGFSTRLPRPAPHKTIVGVLELTSSSNSREKSCFFHHYERPLASRQDGHIFCFPRGHMEASWNSCTCVRTQGSPTHVRARVFACVVDPTSQVGRGANY